MSENRANSSTNIKTRLPDSVLSQYVDVVIHCGDLTEESKLDEFRATIRFLQAVNAPLKLVIAGNHDWTMDIPKFERKVAEVRPPLDPQLVQEIYGYQGESRKLVCEPSTGTNFLDRGTYSFQLKNGALLKVYASPYTPAFGAWGFQYNPNQGHEFSIPYADVVITHGPPKGIMDGQRAGCPYLFEEIARARPRMHCFGHIHHGWGVKLVTWRSKISDKPSHLTDIDNGKSVLIKRLNTLRPEDLKVLSACVASHY
ncbi:hypothetical protein N7495_000637 [Penicillium taxi]|uniref:uncharacterized protein n=1 Tax=Penicillium taxi TaxID=168475 RepID=UPI0025453CE0|nr:uncharacterized protein N7495_000637 [Penicillium taxi]KAJ5907955.1 hypothetical protein N7495_000637 [Penicillium taxi]